MDCIQQPNVDVSDISVHQLTQCCDQTQVTEIFVFLRLGALGDSFVAPNPIMLLVARILTDPHSLVLSTECDDCFVALLRNAFTSQDMLSVKELLDHASSVMTIRCLAGS